MRELERRGAVVAQQCLDAGDEVVRVRHLGEHVVAHHEARLLALTGEARRRLAPEELDKRVGIAAGLGRLRDVRRGVDAEDRDPRPHEVLKQVAVIRRQLDDQVLRAEIEPGAHRLDARGHARPTPSSRRRSTRTR